MKRASKNLGSYMDMLKERGVKKNVTKDFQFAGLEIANILDDNEHKALYIKLAKEYSVSALLRLAKDVADRRQVKNRGAYFMKLLKEYGAKKSTDSNNEK